MAFAALVRSAGAFGGSGSRLAEDTTTAEGDAFAWFCIESLLNAIHTRSGSSIDEHLHRLHLALVAVVPSVSLSLLPRLLDEVRSVVCSYPTSESKAAQKDELVQALFKELAHNVGDAEKEYVMEWWYEHREQLGGAHASTNTPPDVVLTSRL